MINTRPATVVFELVNGAPSSRVRCGPNLGPRPYPGRCNAARQESQPAKAGRPGAGRLPRACSIPLQPSDLQRVIAIIRSSLPSHVPHTPALVTYRGQYSYGKNSLSLEHSAMLTILLSISLLAVTPIDLPAPASPEQPILVAQAPLINPVPIPNRVDRPGHFYGNTVRRRHRRGAIVRVHGAAPFRGRR